QLMLLRRPLSCARLARVYAMPFGRIALSGGVNVYGAFMNAETWFTQLNAWQVMALGLVFFGGIYVLGALAMLGLTRLLASAGIGKPLDTRPLKPDQLQREWRQSFHSILIFGLGMIVP